MMNDTRVNNSPSDEENQVENLQADSDQDEDFANAQATSSIEQEENEDPQINPVEELEQQVERLSAALTESKDQSLRAAAEVENIRRRASNEQVNARKFAIEGFASELLAVKDSLDLAGQVELTADNKAVIEKMQEGLSLTLKQLDRVFEKFSVAVIEPEKGDRLDPEHHQAMTIQQSDEVDNNCVLTVIQKGYKLHDRLLRPAMVVIARTPEEKNPDTEQESA